MDEEEGGGVGEVWGDGGVKVYETYEVKKREKLRCLLLRREKNFIYIYLCCDYFTGKRKTFHLSLLP